MNSAALLYLYGLLMLVNSHLLAPCKYWPFTGIQEVYQQPTRTPLQAFLVQHRLHHLFDDFYQDDQRRWYVVTQMFGQAEDEPPVMQAIACPTLDRATFRRLGSYWVDHHGIYYPALTNFSPRIITLAKADAAFFRDLGFEHLGVDRYHVYRAGSLVPNLAAATLRVYTPNGQRNTDWDFNATAYLISGRYGVNDEDQPLLAAQLHPLRLPTGYKLAFPLPTRKPTSTKVTRRRRVTN